VAFKGNEQLVAEARSRLNDYAEEKAVRDLAGRKEAKINKAASDRADSKKNGKTTLVTENKKPVGSKTAKSVPAPKGKNNTVADGTPVKPKSKNSRDRANKSS
jgi:hypothetical protein